MLINQFKCMGNSCIFSPWVFKVRPTQFPSFFLILFYFQIKNQERVGERISRETWKIRKMDSRKIHLIFQVVIKIHPLTLMFIFNTPNPFIILIKVNPLNRTWEI